MAVMQIVYVLYAVALLGGGVMGFVRAGSTPSLIGSSVFAAMAVAAAVLTGRNPTTGIGLGLATAVLVAGFFLYRFLNSGKFMPAGAALAMSLIVLVISLVALAGRLRASGG